MVIYKNASKIQKFCILQVAFFSLKFVSLSYDSVISSHVIIESSIILTKYFPFSRLHEEEFKAYFSQT